MSQSTPSPPTRPTSSQHKNVDIALETAHTVLSAVKDAAPLLPIPYFLAAVASAITILEAIQVPVLFLRLNSS
jgi:hypothetical protein